MDRGLPAQVVVHSPLVKGESVLLPINMPQKRDPPRGDLSTIDGFLGTILSCRGVSRIVFSSACTLPSLQAACELAHATRTHACDQKRRGGESAASTPDAAGGWLKPRSFGSPNESQSKPGDW